jgi:hypothetical protein
MLMQVESLEVLEQAEVAPAQARAIVRAIEIEIAGARDILATKHDVLSLRQDMSEFATKHNILSLRQDLSALATKSEVASLRQEISALATKTEVGSRHQEVAEMRGELKAEIHSTVSGVTRQMYVAVLGQMAVLLGFAYFFATHLR